MSSTETRTARFMALYIASAKALARKLAEAHRGCPVEIQPDADFRPTFRGESFFWTTPSGQTVIRHPGAYGWPMAYHASTLRVEVSPIWWAQHTAVPGLHRAALQEALLLDALDSFSS